MIFFSLKYIYPGLDLPQYVSARQLAFVELGKSSFSAMNINPLFPDFRSFFNNAPQALNHSLMRPYLSEVKNFFYLPVALEILIYEILLLAYLFFPLKTKGYNAFVCFGVFFSLSMFLIIGYTIPILGALIRYRSVYFIFLITPVTCLTDFARIKRATTLF